jgi:hypothetical protein
MSEVHFRKAEVKLMEILYVISLYPFNSLLTHKAQKRTSTPEYQQWRIKCNLLPN